MSKLCVICYINRISKYNFRLAKAMINHFTIKTKLCKIHNLPEAFICTDPLCKFQSLLCSNCAKNGHPHYQSVLKVEDFMQYFADKIRKQRENFDKTKSIINVSALIKTKKQQIEQRQLQLLEHTMKRLSEEKKAIFQSLDLLQKAYLSKENLYKRNLSERSQILNYLIPYSQSLELLELKLVCSSEWGIVNLKNHLLDLDVLSKESLNRNIDATTEIIMKECDKRLQGTFMNSLKIFIMNYFMKPPPMTRQESQQFRPKINSQHNLRPLSTDRKNQSMEAIPKMPSTPSSPAKRFALSRAYE